MLGPPKQPRRIPWPEIETRGTRSFTGPIGGERKAKDWGRNPLAITKTPSRNGLFDL